MASGGACGTHQSAHCLLVRRDVEAAVGQLAPSEPFPPGERTFLPSSGNGLTMGGEDG